MCHVHFGYYWVCWVCQKREFEILHSGHKTEEPHLNIDCTCDTEHIYAKCLCHLPEQQLPDGTVIRRNQWHSKLFLRSHPLCEDPLSDWLLEQYDRDIAEGRSPDPYIHPMRFHDRPNEGFNAGANVVHIDWPHTNLKTWQHNHWSDITDQRREDAIARAKQYFRALGLQGTMEVALEEAKARDYDAEEEAQENEMRRRSRSRSRSDAEERSDVHDDTSGALEGDSQVSESQVSSSSVTGTSITESSAVAASSTTGTESSVAYADRHRR
ncbi:uncharacterized protein HMPREF1541_03391 [Cyphellophora europaea CBS 101466]|uniref:Uncharacterized protein n=1 Tax=Cyphellophora europaea (strain CBS 101466) TaxID=1220924 RepID=W2RYQ7_CYPE1|nr:uncharacterized protein HMPREF1541_03391 [Cyphellophora europaea CBS 101466]ETN41455.1 hypothetical protein HMPREF1541_03391 [Cyphellophora europaea CBS 101466]